MQRCEDLNVGAVICELYVSDIESTVQMLAEVMPIEALRGEANFCLLRAGDSRLLLNSMTPEHFSESNPIRSLSPGAKRGAGIEIVLEVSNVEESFERASLDDSGWLIVEGLRKQSWGLIDFRMTHPDGFYFRISQPDLDFRKGLP